MRNWPIAVIVDADYNDIHGIIRDENNVSVSCIYTGKVPDVHDDVVIGEVVFILEEDEMTGFTGVIERIWTHPRSMQTMADVRVPLVK